VFLSVVLAIVISAVALRLTFQLRDETTSVGSRKLSSAIVMGLAIPVMHYTGMRQDFCPDGCIRTADACGGMSALGIVVISTFTTMILGMTILTSLGPGILRAGLKLQHSMEDAWRRESTSRKVKNAYASP